MQQNLKDELNRWATASVPELLRAYQELAGTEPRSRNRRQLFRLLAWRLQARETSGLSAAALRRAAELVDPTDLRVSSATCMPVRRRRTAKRLAPGTVITRQYKGQQLEVKVLEHGFEFADQVFRSLSGVAKHITGAHWNGHLFFQVKRRGA